ncbi:uncharacterized protein LOC133782210 [Humulus lupulus]|uniref:uncharacterized protein LOC133782210 n=1 Tax=Humulus lupulus TaxID=3486 RepID=UPI002B412371|nr:uncharacterized protein LOC133782210 [Humulus lupulus]
MLACKLISAGQMLALRRTQANQPVARELALIPEGDATDGDDDELNEEDEVSLVRRNRVLEATQGLNVDRVQSGAAAGPSGQGNLYLFRDLDRAAAYLRLARFNPSQLIHRHRDDPDLNITLLQCVDQLVLRHDMGRPRGTVVVYNTSSFRSAFFEEYGTNLRSWPSLLEGVVAPGLRQYVEESSPEADPDPEPPLIREVIDLSSPIEAPRPEVVAINSSSSLEGEEMAWPGDNVLRSIFQGGILPPDRPGHWSRNPGWPRRLLLPGPPPSFPPRGGARSLQPQRTCPHHLRDLQPLLGNKRHQLEPRQFFLPPCASWLTPRPWRKSPRPSKGWSMRPRAIRWSIITMPP